MSATERYGFDLVANLARAAEELDAAFAGAWAPNLKTMVKATRTYGYFGGPELQLDGTIAWYLNGTVVCPNNALSLVQREPFTGMVIAANPPILLDGYRPMAVARCVSGNLTRFVDARDAVLGKGARLLDDLEDVSLYDLQDGDILTYVAALGVWVNLPAESVGGVDAEEEGALILANASKLDFRGDVTVSDEGGGRARVAIQSAGGGIGFPYSTPASPSVYDDEGKSGSLSGIWTVVEAPGAGFSYGSGFQGDYLYMDSPGAATGNRLLLRQPVSAEGAAGTLITLTTRLLLPSGAGIGFVDLGISNNATFVTGNYWLASLVGNKVQVYDGTLRVDTTIATFGYEIWIHIRRGTDNVVRFYASTNGISWLLIYTSATWANEIDYIWIRMLGHTAAATSRHLVDFVRVNDARFNQFV